MSTVAPALDERSSHPAVVSSLRIGILLDDQFGIRRVVQRDEGGLAQSLLTADNQTAVLQLPEDPRGTLAAAVELDLCLLQGEVQTDGAVRLDIAVLTGDAGSVQQKCIEHLGVVADVAQGLILQKKPRKRHITLMKRLIMPTRRFLTSTLSLRAGTIVQMMINCFALNTK